MEGGGGRAVLIYLPCWLFSLLSFLPFVPRAPPLDPPLGVQGVQVPTTATPRTTSIKKKLYFAYESRDTLKPFSLLFFVKTISKLIMEYGAKIRNINFIRCGSRSPSKQNLVISRCCFAEDDE